MAHKEFRLDEQIVVKVYKRTSSRSLRLTIAPDGEVRVSIPTWTPYQAGAAFARSRLEWIKAQRRPKQELRHGQPIGKAHHLRLMAKPGSSSIKTRVMASEVLVTYPSQVTPTHESVQKAAETASIRALRTQAEQLLPERLAELAKLHGFEYGSVTIKRLKGRWGSCDQHQNIVLNLYLMLLPWECIDYVLLHELTHTDIMRHGPEFWAAMEGVLPTVKQVRKRMREYQPTLLGI